MADTSRKTKILRIVTVILLLVWMGFIFDMSAKPADDSDEMSLSVGIEIGRIFVSDFRQMSAEDQIRFAEKIDHPVRKTAHATEYAVLGLLMYPAVYCAEKKKGMNIRKIFLLSILFSSLYAVSDEIHQTFVPGRSCQLTDVLIDTGGACAGILICFFIVRAVSKKSDALQ